MNEEEKRYFAETRSSLNSDDLKIVRARINELKSKGNADLLPLLFDLLTSKKHHEAREDIVSLLNDLRDQECAPVIAKYIEGNIQSESIAEIIASCWQSRLDYSQHLSSFAKSFISGNMHSAVECFTVIEEMLWKTSEENINACRKYLVEHIAEVEEQKKPLYHELINVLEQGRSKNSEDYPELYQ